MYRAFKIKSNDNLMTVLSQKGNSASRFNELYESITAEQSKPDLKAKLLKMIRDSALTIETLDADSIWDEWFLEIKADVVISHSSKDAALAKTLANWLKENHQLTSFIDSEIWGHSDELLKELDNEYCLNHGGETYSYEKRNGSTSHVHMMLSYALTRMIDRTECFIFLESHNSSTAKESVSGTFSPWIFHELPKVDTIKPNKPIRVMKKLASQRFEAVTESFNLKIKYPLLGKRLREIDYSDVSSWAASAQQSQAHSLDLLYQGASLQEGDQ